MKRIISTLLAFMALSFVIALSSCAASEPNSQTIEDVNDCSENDRFKDDCQ